VKKKQKEKEQRPRSPGADPIPPWTVMEPDPEPWKWWVRWLDPDPTPWKDLLTMSGLLELLDKAKVAQIKVAQLDMAIEQMQKNMDYLKLQRDMLKEEYQLK
jgi:hypothetical protein